MNNAGIGQPVKILLVEDNPVNQKVTLIAIQTLQKVGGR